MRFVRWFFVIVSLLFGLASGLAAVGLVWVGVANGWTSDGPGMLIVMVGIPFCALFAFLGGSLGLSLLATPAGDD